MTSYEDMEFVFTKEYSKMFKPVFSGNYDFDAEEEKGTITVTLTTTPKETAMVKPLECRQILTA